MFGTNDNTSGFTLLELLIVLLILGILGSFIAPAFSNRTPRYQREQFIAGLNALMHVGLTQAISTHMLHQVYVDMKKHEISLRKHTGEYDKSGEPICTQVPGEYIHATQSIPEQFIFKQFWIEGINEIQSGSKTNELWFYIVPGGLTQYVTINMLDTQDTLENDKPRPIGLVLNPFMAQFKVYDAFQK